MQLTPDLLTHVSKFYVNVLGHYLSVQVHNFREAFLLVNWVSEHTMATDIFNCQMKVLGNINSPQVFYAFFKQNQRKMFNEVSSWAMLRQLEGPLMHQ